VQRDQPARGQHITSMLLRETLHLLPQLLTRRHPAKATPVGETGFEAATAQHPRPARYRAQLLSGRRALSASVCCLLDLRVRQDAGSSLKRALALAEHNEGRAVVELVLQRAWCSVSTSTYRLPIAATSSALANNELPHRGGHDARRASPSTRPH